MRCQCTFPHRKNIYWSPSKMNGTNLCVDPELVLSIWILLPNIAGTSISYPKYGVHTGAAITNDVTKSKIVGWGYKGIQVKECRDLPTMVIYIIKCSRKKNIYKFLSVFVFSRIDFQNSRTQCQIQVSIWVFFQEILNLRTFQGKNKIQGLSRTCTNPVAVRSMQGGRGCHPLSLLFSIDMVLHLSLWKLVWAQAHTLPTDLFSKECVTNLVIYSAHQKSGDSLSFSYYLPLQHNVVSNLKKNSYAFSNTLI